LPASNKINLEALRQTTRENRERIEREQAESSAQNEARKRREVERPAKRKAREVIAGLSEVLEKAALAGLDGKSVFQMRDLADQVAAEIITAHCEKQGLKVKTKHESGTEMSSAYDYLVVSW
jgi:hypothetical protein